MTTAKTKIEDKYKTHQANSRWVFFWWHGNLSEYQHNKIECSLAGHFVERLHDRGIVAPKEFFRKFPHLPKINNFAHFKLYSEVKKFYKKASYYED